MRSRFKAGDTVPGWACIASLDIIEDSAKAVVRAADKYQWHNVIIPRPGCGAGELNWSTVKSVLEKHLDDRFNVISY